MLSTTARLVCALAFAAGSDAAAEDIRGSVRDRAGAPLVGAQVTVQSGAPAHRISVWSDAEGRFATPELPSRGPWTVRARRIGWRDAERTGVLAGSQLVLEAERLGDAAEVAAQLPANHWWSLVLERFEATARARAAEARVHVLPPAGQRAHAPPAPRGRVAEGDRADGAPRRAPRRGAAHAGSRRPWSRPTSPARAVPRSPPAGRTRTRSRPRRRARCAAR